MEKVYTEQIVRREMSIKDWAIRIGTILLTLLLCFIVLNVFYQAFAILLALGCWFSFVVWRRMSKEYEYIFTDGQLDVDCIYSRSNRRSMVSLSSRDIEVIAPASDKQYEAMFNKKYDKFLDAGRGGIRENTYVVICNREDKSLKMYFEPNEEMLELLHKYMPRTLVMKK